VTDSAHTACPPHARISLPARARAARAARANLGRLLRAAQDVLARARARAAAGLNHGEELCEAEHPRDPRVQPDLLAQRRVLEREQVHRLCRAHAHLPAVVACSGHPVAHGSAMVGCALGRRGGD